MTFPQHARMALSVTDDMGISGTLNFGDHVCAGAKFHSPNPLVLHEVEPKLWMCGTCSDNLLVLQHLLEQNNGRLKWPVLRDFGNQIRAIALKDWPTISLVEMAKSLEEGEASA